MHEPAWFRPEPAPRPRRSGNRYALYPFTFSVVIVHVIHGQFLTDLFLRKHVDIFEVMPGHEMPGTGPVNAFMSSSLQVAPGIPKGQHRPVNGKELNSSYTWYVFRSALRISLSSYISVYTLHVSLTFSLLNFTSVCMYITTGMRILRWASTASSTLVSGARSAAPSTTPAPSAGTNTWRMPSPSTPVRPEGEN